MITAIIPARSGSKRLQGKNIKNLSGRPLMFYTIDAVLGHEEINSVILTTDSEKYIDLAKETYGDTICYECRPPEYANDTAKVYDEIKRLVKTGVVKTPWYIQCLPTCPLRDHKVVRSLLDQWKLDWRPIFSAVAYEFATQFAFNLSANGRGWKAISEQSPMITGNTRSQDIPNTYRPNGAMYLQHVDNIENKTLYTFADVFLMTREESIDVDTNLDFLICEQLLANRKTNE